MRIVRDFLKRFPLAIHLYRFINAIWLEDLNQGNKLRFSRNYINWYIFQKPRKQRVLIRLMNGMKAWVYADSDAGVSNLFTRNVDFYETLFIRKFIKPGDFIIDAGCNIGNRTLVLADIISGALMVDANPICFQRLQENFLLNQVDLSQYHLISKAVGAKAGVVHFSDEGSSSCQNHIITDHLLEPGTREVEMITLDEALAAIGHEQCKFIKLDLEGFDFDGLQGAQQILKKGSVALVEFERWQRTPLAPFLDFFKDMGWTVVSLDHKGEPAWKMQDLEQARNLFALSPEAWKKINPDVEVAYSPIA